MTLNTAAEAARLSTSPMTDGSDFRFVSIACQATLAVGLHVSIVSYRIVLRRVMTRVCCLSWTRTLRRATAQMLRAAALRADAIPCEVISALREDPQIDRTRRPWCFETEVPKARVAKEISQKGTQAMADCTLAASKMSSYGLAARVVLEEKGVAYDRIVVDPADQASPKHLAEVHPFGKVPTFYHNGFHLYETAAIARYVDEAFDGPALQPEDVRARATMQKWISITGQYIYPAVISDLVMQRLAPKIGAFGGVTDEDVVAASVPVISHQLDLIGQALDEGAGHLAGDFSLADIMVATMVQYIGLTPEREELLASRPVVSEWVQRVTSRPSYEAAAYDLGF